MDTVSSMYSRRTRYRSMHHRLGDRRRTRTQRHVPRQVYRVYAYYDIDYEESRRTLDYDTAIQHVTDFLDDFRKEGRHADAIIEIQQGDPNLGDWETVKQWTPRDIWNFPMRAWEYG